MASEGLSGESHALKGDDNDALSQLPELTACLFVVTDSRGKGNARGVTPREIASWYTVCTALLRNERKITA